jgi:hypothetical protein
VPGLPCCCCARDLLGTHVTMDSAGMSMMLLVGQQRARADPAMTTGSNSLKHNVVRRGAGWGAVSGPDMLAAREAAVLSSVLLFTSSNVVHQPEPSRTQHTMSH